MELKMAQFFLNLSHENTSCQKCKSAIAKPTCSSCIVSECFELSQVFRISRCEILKRREAVLADFDQICSPESACSGRRISYLRGECIRVKSQISCLEQQLKIFRSAVCLKRDQIECIRYGRTSLLMKLFSRHGMRNRILPPKPEYAVSFDAFLKDPGKYERILSAMHPYRKLRGLAHSLSEERRGVCMKILSMYKFRQVSVHGVRDQIWDVTQDELSGSVYSGIIRSFASLALIQLAQVLDISLPFPLAYGTLVSSTCLHRGQEMEGQIPYFPKILHAYKRRLVEGSSNLLLENFRLLVSQANQVNVGSVLVQRDLLQCISAVISGYALGKEIFSAKAVTPSLSAAYRIVEQSVTEGGEWTLLDQL